ELALKNFSFFENRVCFNGHSHVPAVYTLHVGAAEDELENRVERAKPRDGEVFELREGCRYLVNVGSVGQPRDGDPRSCYVIFEPESGRVTFRRVDYDIALTQGEMERVGLPKVLAERLSLGR
ncbi:MAG: metallophosphoesterase family protein, partial [Candidatus Geothermincolia bacterium]